MSSYAGNGRREVHAVDDVTPELIHRAAGSQPQLRAASTSSRRRSRRRCGRCCRGRRCRCWDSWCSGKRRMPLAGCSEYSATASSPLMIDGNGVGHAFADGAGEPPAHAADHPPRQAVPVLVVDDVGVDVAVAAGGSGVPEIHLHPRTRAVAWAWRSSRCWCRRRPAPRRSPDRYRSHRCRSCSSGSCLRPR